MTVIATRTTRHGPRPGAASHRRPGLAQGGIGVLEVAVALCVIFPWRSMAVSTAPPTRAHVLSYAATVRAVGAVHDALAVATRLRVLAEVLVLVAAVLAVVLLASGAARRPRLVVVTGAQVVLAAAACLALPLFNTSAGLTVHLVALPAPAAWAALGLSTAALVLAALDRGNRRRGGQAVSPPSMATTAPTMNLASSDATNATSSAISSGVA